MGKAGPKAAGRAANDVLLSSAIVMIAFGGNSVKGVVKEKKDLNVDFEPVGRDDAARVGWATDVIARQRRKRQAAKKKTRMKILGGRIVR